MLSMTQSLPRAPMASFFAEIDAIGAIEEIFTSELDYIYGFGA